ncbi:MAG: HNH endonuclease [Thermodesulfobacteriota bacterium]|nr:HNH endonuclease [Thermodesulfobacteriota bacterium]
MYHHRWIMEQHLGRKLLPTETIHHVDENKLNNKIDNLQLFKNSGEHIHLKHKPQGHVCKVPGCNRPTCECGYCVGHYKRFYRYGRVFANIPLSQRYGSIPLPKIELMANIPRPASTI